MENFKALTEEEFLNKFEILTASHAEKFNGGICHIKNSPIKPNSIRFISMIFDEKSFNHGFELNDPNRVFITIDQIGDDLFEARSAMSSLRVVGNITANQVEIPFNVIKGSAEKVIEGISEFQEKRLSIVKENYSSIKGIEKSNLKDLV